MLIRRPSLSELLIGAGWLVAGLGLSFLRKWGRYLFVTTAVVSIALIIMDLLVGDGFQKIQAIKGLNSNPAILLFVVIKGLTLTFCCLGIYYFTRAGVKERFR